MGCTGQCVSTRRLHGLLCAGIFHSALAAVIALPGCPILQRMPCAHRLVQAPPAAAAQGKSCHPPGQQTRACRLPGKEDMAWPGRVFCSVSSMEA
jgi:hypothetical protein